MRDATALAKRCPACGRTLRLDSLRCGYCLTEVRDVAPVAAAPVMTTPARPSVVRHVLGEGWERLRRLPRWMVLAAIAVLLVGGWFSYRALKPERSLPLPASAARTLPSSADAWGSAGGDSGNTRSTAAALQLQRAAAVWQSDLGATVSGEPVADAERLYVATTANRVVALRLTDGSAAWVYEAPVPIGDGPIAAGDRVYLTTRRGDVVALEARSGAVVWETALQTNFYNAPTLRDGVVYAYGSRRQLYALAAEDGQVLWTIGTGSDWSATEPALVTSRSIVIATDSMVKLYDRVHGSLTLEHPHGRVVGMAQLDDRLVTVSANFIAAVDPAARLPWWWRARGVWYDLWVWGLAPEPGRAGLAWLHDLRPVQGGPQTATVEVFPPALGGGLAVVATDQGVVRAFDLEGGDERWTIETGPVTGAPVITADGLALPLRDAISLRSMTDGAEVGRLPLPGATRRSLVVTSNGAFLVEREGRITGVRQE